MRLPKAAHISRPWRIHELTPDFRLEDVWLLPTPGGREDFPLLVASDRLGRRIEQPLARRSSAVGNSLEAGGAARLGLCRGGHRVQGADAPRPLTGGPARGSFGA